MSRISNLDFCQPVPLGHGFGSNYVSLKIIFDSEAKMTVIKLASQTLIVHGLEADLDDFRK